MTVLLTTHQVITLNQTFGGVVRDTAGVEAAVGRLTATWAGEDLLPSFPEKAAALLHAISSTQCFSDGNKRTAWIAFRTFLQANSYTLKHTSRIEREIVVVSAATNLINLGQLTEWVKEHALPEDAMTMEITGGAYSIKDLVVAGGTIGGIRATGATFYGPALLIPVENVRVVASTVDADGGGPDSVIWEIDPQRPAVIGGISMVNCEFVHCVFQGIGFALMPESVSTFLQGVRV